jgi:tetratricopeptide (TPR) repeat protein
MRRSLVSVFFVLFLFPVLASAQRDSSRNDFTNAESWFLFEEYNEAEAIYQKLLKWDPDNDNLKYKIGICLLNDPYRKEQSLGYLLEASNNINPEYKESSFKERTAPPDVLYYLGSAYLVNERLDPAKEAFQHFLEIMDPEVYDEELVRAQIQSCENARRLMSMPVDIDLYPVSQAVNTRYAETNPVISMDGQRMAFVTKQPFFDEALFIEKVNGEWTLPMSLTSMLGFDQDIYPVALNYDGTEMLLYYDDELIGNLYTSRYEDGFWLPAEKLGENISTKYWESHACFTKDGQTLYFTSNRKGTIGGLDIYTSRRLPDGKWGIPENLGPTINTRYNEETPFITEDDQTLFFSSYGHYNMGGYDIFYSTRNKDGSWGEPVNLGYPINTTDDDIFFQPVNNGFSGYQSRFEKSTRGRHDLYLMDIYSVNNPRMYLVTGFVRTEDGDTDLTTLEMFVIDPETGDTVKYSIPIDEAGAFTLNLTQGEYNLHFTGEGYEEMIRPLSITPGSDKEGITLDEVIELTLVETVPLVFEGEDSQIQMKDSIFEGLAGEPLIVPLKLEKGALLITKVYQDSTLLSVDTMVIEKRRTELEIVPVPGTSLIELEMIDKDGNIHKKSFTVIGTEPVPVQLAEEPEIETAPSLPAGMLGLLLLDLQNESEGDLKEYLESLDPEKQGIETDRELFEHLYVQADRVGYDKKEVDLLLAKKLAGDDAALLYQKLLENSDGPLKEYLEGLDLEEEGIRTPEDLLRHLEEVAEENGFTMEDVRRAMLNGLENPLEVERIYDDLLETSDGTVREILQGIDLQKDGIHTVEELIRTIYNALVERGYSDKEIREILSGLFPSHSSFIKGLLGKGDRGGNRIALPLFIGAGIIALLLLFFLLWARRRKKEE